MITMQQWMELVDYKITEGGDYGWRCYGPNAYTLDSWNGVHGKGGYSFGIVFSTKTQKVYEVSMCDYTNDRAYRMINPKNVEKHRAEAKRRGVKLNEAWDDVDFVDLETVHDFINKARAIATGQDYDERVEIVLELDDATAYEAMTQAHELDITFNEYVMRVIRAGFENISELKDEVQV